MEKGQKNDRKDGKLRWELLPLPVIEEVVRVYTVGAEKYAPNSWQNLEDGENRYIAASLRHLTELRKGNDYDEETGLLHAAQYAWNAISVLYFRMKALGLIGDEIQKSAPVNNAQPDTDDDEEDIKEGEGIDEINVEFSLGEKDLTLRRAILKPKEIEPLTIIGIVGKNSFVSQVSYGFVYAKQNPDGNEVSVMNIKCGSEITGFNATLSGNNNKFFKPRLNDVLDYYLYINNCVGKDSLVGIPLSLESYILKNKYWIRLYKSSWEVLELVDLGINGEPVKFKDIGGKEVIIKPEYFNELIQASREDVKVFEAFQGSITGLDSEDNLL